MWHPDMPDEYKNQIVTGDARELAKRIPDESIDLIFTDPVYDRIEDYEWLAKEANRTLKSDSACLTWTSTPLMPECINAMNKYLDWQWCLYWHRIADVALYPGKAGITVITPCLWFGKGNPKSYPRIADAAMSKPKRNINIFKWQKPFDVVSKWINSLSKEGSIVFDPFCGAGVISASCKILNRNYIAFEIDPDTAELARERVRNTQPPLFVMEPEQLELLDE